MAAAPMRGSAPTARSHLTMARRTRRTKRPHYPGCWNASTALRRLLLSINMKLGIPGDYAGGAIGPFGGSVSLTGDINNPAAYRIVSTAWGPDDYLCLWPSGMQFEVMGITFVQNYNGPLRSIGLSVTGGSAIVHDCRFETLAPNNNGCFIQLYNAQFSGRKGNIHFEGNNNPTDPIFTCSKGRVPLAHSIREKSVTTISRTAMRTSRSALTRCQP